MLLRSQRKRTILVCVSGRYKTGWKETQCWPNVEILMKNVDLWEPTSFLDNVFLGCTQRERRTSKDTVDNDWNMFKSRISAGAFEKMLVSGKPDANIISPWSYDMEGHAKKCVERCCELANKTTQQFFKVLTPCIDDHQFKEEEMESVGELLKVWTECSEMPVLGSYWWTWYF